MSDTIWLQPPEAALAILPRLLAAQSVDALWDAAGGHYGAHVGALEARLDSRLDGMGEMGERLRRDMRPGPFGWIGDLWDRLLGGAQTMAEDADHVADGVFAFRMPLAQTVPVMELDMAGDVVFSETRRLRTKLVAMITADRKIAPQSIILPDDALDFVDETDELDAEGETLLLIGAITHWWPPVADKPALFITEHQEDGGLPVEIELLSHDAVAHAAFVEMVQRSGGSFGPSPA